MLAVPLSLVGPVLVISALKGAGFSNSLYVQIGLLLVMALSAKNAILIVEVAREALERGLSPAEAALEGARTRFRAILMTSFAFILGVAPLVVATGAAQNARRAIGMTAFSGMLASSCLAVVFVPAFFVVIQRLSAHRKPDAPPPDSAEPKPDPGPTEGSSG
jgi:HAE1 family hydrophobic/amphiphilic exporter-1